VASGADNAGTGWYCQTVRVRLARIRRCTREHQCLKLRKRVAGSNLVDMGRNAARDSRPMAGSTPKPGCDAGGEATVKVCGVAVGDAAGVELDAKLIDRFRVNTGTVPGCSGCLCDPRGGSRIGTSSSDGVGTGRRPCSSRGRNDPATEAGRAGHRAKGASKSVVEGLECWESVGEH
jgi:hypothetical protein